MDPDNASAAARAPVTAPRSPSPFEWGFLVTLGAMFAVVFACAVLGLLVAVIAHLAGHTGWPSTSSSS